MVDICKAYIPADSEKERDSINKYQIFRTIDIFM